MSSRSIAWIWANLLGVAIFVLPARALAEVHTYVIAIGNNQAPAGSSEGLRNLQYADDDAADFFTFMGNGATASTLLTVLDTDSQRRFPRLADIARPPTLAELRHVLADYKHRLEADERAGNDPVVYLFFSGHGSREPGKPAALAMLDGPLTQSVLYDEILTSLPARFVHLFVDACHAEAVVRPRDAVATAVDVSPDDVRSLAKKTTLDRFPNVGAVIASASGAQSHEWDVYQRGIFTHEVLSGLRGAADVNGDGKVEYSELYAFLTAANRDVSDSHARLDFVMRPPALDQRAPLVDLTKMSDQGHLVSRDSALGEFWIEDAAGNRLADVHAEDRFRVSLSLPAEETLYVRSAKGEAEIQLDRGGSMLVDAASFHVPTTRARDAADSALRRGLFASAFGPVYYRGFVDSHSDDLVAVPTNDAGTLDDVLWSQNRDIPSHDRSHTAGWIVGAAGAGAAAGALVFAGLALEAQSDFNHTTYQLEAARAEGRFDVDRDVGLALGTAALVGLGASAWMLLH